MIFHCFSNQTSVFDHTAVSAPIRSHWEKNQQSWYPSYTEWFLSHRPFNSYSFVRQVWLFLPSKSWCGHYLTLWNPNHHYLGPVDSLWTNYSLLWSLQFSILSLMKTLPSDAWPFPSTLQNIWAFPEQFLISQSNFFWSSESSYVGDRWWYWSKLMIWKMTFGLHAIYWQEHQYKSLMLVQVSFCTCLHLSAPVSKGLHLFATPSPHPGEKKFFYFLCRRFKVSTKICLQTK